MTEPPGLTGSAKDIAAYNTRMQDPEDRAQMEQTEPFTESEEQQLYSLLDEAFADIDADANAAEQEQTRP